MFTSLFNLPLSLSLLFTVSVTVVLIVKAKQLWPGLIPPFQRGTAERAQKPRYFRQSRVDLCFSVGSSSDGTWAFPATPEKHQRNKSALGKRLRLSRSLQILSTSWNELQTNWLKLLKTVKEASLGAVFPAPTVKSDGEAPQVALETLNSPLEKLNYFFSSLKYFYLTLFNTEKAISLSCL